MVRIALLALMVIALDLAWWLLPSPGDSVEWPRVAAIGGCSITLHEPRRDPVADNAGEHTLRLAFACSYPNAGRARAGSTAPRTLRGTAVVIGSPDVEAGAYAVSGARVALISLPTSPDPVSDGARECRTAIEAALSGAALHDADPRYRAVPIRETVLAGPDSRVYALRDGAWWREEPDGSWTRIALQGSAAARRDARLAPLERTMAERQLRDGR